MSARHARGIFISLGDKTYTYFPLGSNMLGAFMIVLTRYLKMPYESISQFLIFFSGDLLWRVEDRGHHRNGQDLRHSRKRHSVHRIHVIKTKKKYFKSRILFFLFLWEICTVSRWPLWSGRARRRGRQRGPPASPSPLRWTNQVINTRTYSQMANITKNIFTGEHTVRVHRTQPKIFLEEEIFFPIFEKSFFPTNSQAFFYFIFFCENRPFRRAKPERWERGLRGQPGVGPRQLHRGVRGQGLPGGQHGQVCGGEDLTHFLNL